MKQANFKQKRCKLTSFSVLLMLVAVFGLSLTIQAQVTIGTMEEPVGGSLLQLKEIDTNDGVNAYKGLALPRVALSKKDELYPMLSNDADYAANKDNLKRSHIGLIVYNLTEDEDEDLSPGLYRWTGEEWVSSDSKMGSAQFDEVTDCSAITVNGVYIENTPATSANYLTITLNVRKAGAFVIMATTGKGYSFYLSGVALNVGEVMTVNVPCQGVPSNENIGPPDYERTDELSFSGINVSCVKTVKVVSAVAEYSINCSSITVTGNYLKGQSLTNQTITLNVTVATAGSFSISTPLTNGIRFSRSGELSVGTQTIILIGEGAPTVNEDFSITINANTPKGNNTCSTVIPATLPPMTFAIIGNDIWSWNTGPRINALLNLSLSGVIKIVSFTQLWHESTPAAAATRLNNISAQKPDVVLYFAYPNAPTPASGIIPALANYINKGGCVIYGYSSGNAISNDNELLNGIFGVGVASARLQTSGGADHVYPIANLPNDPIINGPFGNLSSRYWGEDNDNVGTAIVTTLPPNSVQICSAANQHGLVAVNPTYSVVWYNDSKNCVYFGDCTGASSTDTSTGAYPAIYRNNLPQEKRYGNSSSIQYVYNSALELNAVVWAIRKAATSGINPH